MKKIVILVLALALVLSMVAGCGSSSKTEVVYWSMWDAAEPQAQVIAQAAKDFEAETGIRIKIEFKGRNGIREGLVPALDANSNIDIFDEDISRVNITWKNYVMDLTSMVEATDYLDSANMTLINMIKDMSDGKITSLPYQPAFGAIFYHPSIFAEAGITEIPTTWDEFMDACAKIKAAGYIPMTNDDAYMTFLFSAHIVRYLGQDAFIDIIENKKWDDPAILKAAKDFENMAKLGYFSPNIGGNKFPAGQNSEFAAKKVAMYYDGSWVANEVRNITGDGYAWGAMNWPTVEGGKTGTETGYIGAQGFAINKKSTKADEALQFIMYMTTGAVDSKLAKDTLGLPIDSSNTEWPVELENAKDAFLNITNPTLFDVGISNNVDAASFLKENMTKLVAGTITAEQFVQNMIDQTK